MQIFGPHRHPDKKLSFRRSQDSILRRLIAYGALIRFRCGHNIYIGDGVRLRSAPFMAAWEMTWWKQWHVPWWGKETDGPPTGPTCHHLEAEIGIISVLGVWVSWNQSNFREIQTHYHICDIVVFLAETENEIDVTFRIKRSCLFSSSASHQWKCFHLIYRPRAPCYYKLKLNHSNSIPNIVLVNKRNCSVMGWLFDLRRRYDIENEWSSIINWFFCS